jgi:ribokinase
VTRGSSLVVVGSLNADLVTRVPRFPAPGETVTGTGFAIHPGGKGANQACAASRLGATVHMIGRLGDDANGRLLESSLQTAGVDTSGLLRDPGAPTGTALITIDETGQNQIVIVPGANHGLSVGDVEGGRERIERAGFLLLQLEVPLDVVEAAARIARRAGTVVVLDPAPARREALSLLPLCDYVTPNEIELACLAADPTVELPPAELAARLLDRGARRVVAKLGASGALLLGDGAERRFEPFPVAAVDTTAAGDVWNGAFAAALAEGVAVDEAGRFASAAAAVSVTRRGAQPSMPTRPEVIAFMETKGEP